MRNSTVFFSIWGNPKAGEGEEEKEKSVISGQYDLPMDLITDILIRLPVKSLIRFKSVSKSWFSLIQTPNFIKLHLHFSKLNPHPIFSSIISLDQITRKNFLFRLNFIDALHKPIDMNLPFMPGKFCRVLGISNGLLCLMLGDRNRYSCDVIISNPVTGNFRKIPPFGSLLWCEDDSFYGFDSNGNGFELIRINCYSSSVKVCSFSSSANLWKDVKVKTGRDMIHTVRPLFWGRLPVFKDGVFYWESYRNGVGYVLKFDVFNKVLDEILVPCAVLEFELLELKEQLVVINIANKVTDLWTRNENDKTWKMFKSIDLGDRIPEYGIVAVLGCTGNGKLVLRHYDYSNSKLYLCDMDSDDIDSLHYVYVKGGNRMYLFAESLAAVETGDFGDEV